MEQGAMEQGAMERGTMGQGAMEHGTMGQGAVGQGAMGQGAMGQGAMERGTMGQSVKRSAGVLLPLTMLPGPFGVGVLGKEAKAFVDFLREGGFSLWQMLPVEHLGTSFSPYKCVSAFAGDPMLIDPRWLLERGWVTEAELDDRCKGMDTYRVNYEQVYDKQMILLRAAFARLSERVREDV
ncbi:MAG: 4-alpha-glucanotransferase, partial [Peptococcaceae bacterium]|nr:4-alpha-glucanotransferase [Peptococcaceae bacterium]